MRLARATAGSILWVLATMSSVCPSVALELITGEEAQLPADTTRVRGITRGPKVILTWPAPNTGSVQSPVHLKIRFQSWGGDQVDSESVVVTYMKVPLIDLTQRVRPYIHTDGIDIDDAIIPPGQHRIRVEVMDTAGRLGVLDFTFNVRN